MVAVVFQDAVGLVIDPLVHRLAVADGGGLVGPAGLDLEIETEFVRRLERRFRRAVGMKAHQVQPVAFRDADDAPPLLDFHRRMPGLGEDGALQRAADEGLLAVDGDLGAGGGDFAEAKGNGLFLSLRPLQNRRHKQAIPCWLEFTPIASCRFVLGTEFPQFYVPLKESAFRCP
jgi:hypothetical protein